MRYALNAREELDLLVSELKTQRHSFESVWRDIADLASPYRLRLNLSDYNRGDRKNTRIYDSTALEALDTLESGLTTAATDPSSQWIRYTTRDPERAEFGRAKQFLETASQQFLKVCDGSGAYLSLANGYGNSALFGISAMSVEENFRGKVIHTRSFPPGSFWVGQDDEGDANVFHREMRMTVRQLYLKFGDQGRYSTEVQNLMDHGDWEEWVDVGHTIKPNMSHDPNRPFAEDKAWSSCWYELGSTSTTGHTGYKDSLVAKDAFLRNGGFDEFPIMVGRWDATEGEVYPQDYPGIQMLGDNRSLQIGEKRGWQYIEKGVNPHWLMPQSIQGQADDGLMPGGTTWLPSNDHQAARPLHEVDPGFLVPLEAKQQQVRKRIQNALHYPTFSMFSTLEDKTRTATEIMERKSEKLLKLVKMYSNLTKGVLRPFANRVFGIMYKQGMLGEIPEELQGRDLDYQYQGILAQAQRMTKVQPDQAFLNTVIAVAAAKPTDPSVWDCIDIDQTLQTLASNMGVDPANMRSDEQMEMLRQARAQQAQAAQMAQMLPAMAKSAKDLAGADMEGKNALTALVGS